jgi:hypothetical protein
MIVELILNRLKDHLTEKIPDAEKIVVGRFQDSPLENHTYLAISSGNTRNDTTVDGIVSLGDMANISMKLPGREVGGGSYWWRRGVIDIGYYGVAEGMTLEETVHNAYNFLGRVHHWTELARVSDLTDEFGEHAMKIFVYQTTFTQSGGPETQYIYRGQVSWQVMTARIT